MCGIIRQAFASADLVEAPSLQNARRALAEHSFDLIVLDLGLPDGRGEDFIPEIQQHQPNAYIVISTIHDESDRLLRALRNGAMGYLLKEQPAEQLVAEFQGLSRGRPPLAPAVTRRVLEHLRGMGAPDQTQLQTPAARSDAEPAETLDAVQSLTAREREIFVMLAKGFSRPEIAGFLNISKHTVASHVEKIYRKLDISTRSEAAVIAEQHKMI